MYETLQYMQTPASLRACTCHCLCRCKLGVISEILRQQLLHLAGACWHAMAMLYALECSLMDLRVLAIQGVCATARAHPDVRILGLRVANCSNSNVLANVKDAS